MKKLILVALLLVSSIAYSQKYYVCAGPSVSFGTSINDPRDLLGASIEFGKYFKKVSLGLSTGFNSLYKEDIYQALVLSIPIPKSNFSVSANMGYMYVRKDILMGVGVNYGFELPKNTSLILTYGVQSSLSSISNYFSFSINKDF
jgi:hypothetical protein